MKFAEEAAANGAVDEASKCSNAANKSLANSVTAGAGSPTGGKGGVGPRTHTGRQSRTGKEGRGGTGGLGRDQIRAVGAGRMCQGPQQARREQEVILAAQERLKTEPDDPDACLAVGRWYCFQQGDWDEGLKLLAKGSDDALKSLAAEELASKPAKAEDKVARGDAWWDLAEKATGKAKAAMRRRAGHWYQEATAGPAAGPGEIEDRKTSCASGRRAAAGAEGQSYRIRPPLAVAPFNEKTAKQHQGGGPSTCAYPW